MEAPISVGIDVGGTFTDLIAYGADGDTAITKVPSSPDSPEQGVLDAIEEFLSANSMDFETIDSLMHGSTVTTNALLEETGANTALLMTAGYSAVPVVGTQARRESDPIAPFYTEDDDAFLLPSEKIREVPERTSAEGTVRDPLDEEAVRTIAQEFQDREIESVAICYLFSFLNGRHEELTREILAEEIDECHFSLSSAVIPKIREFPRLSTTVIDAYSGPVLRDYLHDLNRGLAERGLSTDHVYFMLSDGGLVPFETARSVPAKTLLSGPAAGVQGAKFFGDIVDEDDIVTMDMGGTSCDVSIIRDGSHMEAHQHALGGHLVSLPSIEIESIGAGGGTQANVEAGRLRVGPESAGAVPGPICYDRGGDIPTVTDANVLLGRLNPEQLLDGKIDVANERARRIVENQIARPLSMSVPEAAAAILEIVNDKMKKEINLALSRYGFDPREFVLFAFGGAGPTHAASIARRLEIPAVVIPPWPGINSAAGLLSTDIRQEYIQSRLSRLPETSERTVRAQFATLDDQAIDDRLAEGFDRSEIELERRLDLRYEGQGYELTVDVQLEAFDKQDVRDAFDALHESRFGHANEGTVEIVSYRVASVVRSEEFQLSTTAGSGGDVLEPDHHRETYDLRQREWVDTPVFRRSKLPPQARLSGPVVIEQLDSTTVIERGQTVRMDGFGNLICEVLN